MTHKLDPRIIVGIKGLLDWAGEQPDVSVQALDDMDPDDLAMMTEIVGAILAATDAPRPIADAPRDGTPILVICGGEPIIVRWVALDGGYWESGCAAYDDGSFSELVMMPVLPKKKEDK